MTNLHTRAPTRAAEEPPTDAELLARWRAGRDAEALEALVRRHGGMVFGVCRRVLGNAPDAQDAFQATFLIFLQKAGTLDRPAEAAGWLHAVALRVARKARAARSRRQSREVALVDVPDPATPDDAGDLRRTLDEELDRLPEKYRLPIVLCELEGHTLEEAARLLGWPKGTVAGRLSRGRELLRRRLSRRGVGLPLFLPGLVALGPESPPNQLVCATIASAVGTPSPAPAPGAADAAGAAARWGGGRPWLGVVALLFLTAAALIAAGWYTRPAAAAPTAPVAPATPAENCGCGDAS